MSIMILTGSVIGDGSQVILFWLHTTEIFWCHHIVTAFHFVVRYVSIKFKCLSVFFFFLPTDPSDSASPRTEASSWN